MSEPSISESFNLLWEMVKGPLLNPDDLYSYEIDSMILNQVRPWNELQKSYPVASGGLDDRSHLELYLEQHFLELQPELSLEDLEELTEDRIRQIEAGSPLTEGEQENQGEATESLSDITFYSFEHEGRTIYWAGEFEASGMGHFYDRSYGPFQSLDDAWSIVSAMNWPDFESILTDNC